MMSNTPARDLRRGLVTAALGAAGVVTGLVVATILTLNLHIFAGVEDGYMATPAQVLERSVWILVADAVILVAAPLLAVILVVRLRRERHDASQRPVASPDG
jgi:general stress protein CsbA